MGMFSKTIIVLIAAIALTLSMFGVFRYITTKNILEKELEENITAVSHRLALSLSRPVYDFDLKNIRNTVQAEFGYNAVFGVFIWTPKNKELLYGAVKGKDQPEKAILPPENKNLLKHSNNIFINENNSPEKTVVGEVTVYLTRDLAEKKLRHQVGMDLLEFFTLGIILVLFTGFLIKKYLLGPIEKLRSAMDETEKAASLGILHQKDPIWLRKSHLDLSENTFLEIKTMGESLYKMVNAIKKS